MTAFQRCVLYLSLVAVFSFFLGILVPRRWFSPHRFPYRSYRLERNGQIYEILRIRKWQKKLPDISRLFPRWVPPKKLSADYKKQLYRLLQENCIAEWVHRLNCFAGLYCIRLFPGGGGVAFSLVYAVCHLPFILVQRFNRPRLIKLANRLQHPFRKSPAVADNV